MESILVHRILRCAYFSRKKFCRAPSGQPIYFVIVSQGGARRRACRWAGICCSLQGKKTFYGDVDRTFLRKPSFIKTGSCEFLGQRPVNHCRRGSGVSFHRLPLAAILILTDQFRDRFTVVDDGGWSPVEVSDQGC